MFGAPTALLGHQDALHLLLTDTLAQVLVHHHALVLELLPELLVLIVAGAELKLLLNAEEVSQLMSKRGCRRFEGRYFGLLIESSVSMFRLLGMTHLIRQKTAFRAQLKNIQSVWTHRS